VCFPHAGGSAGFYLPFSAALYPRIEVLAIQYPGRQDRGGEPFVETITELADVVAAVLLAAEDDRPLALFGHSMGALVAYEVARRLEAVGTALAGLFVSARGAPSGPRPAASRHRSDADLVAALRRLDGTDAAVLTDAALLQLILPAVRNDFRALDSYTYRPGAGLGCPVTALVGDADPTTTIAQADAWRRHTTGAFARHVFPGGHFYLTTQRPAALEAISDRLLPIGATSSRTG
jgi:surfactin synthase thioesterase subunit